MQTFFQEFFFDSILTVKLANSDVLPRRRLYCRTSLIRGLYAWFHVGRGREPVLNEFPRKTYTLVHPMQHQKRGWDQVHFPRGEG